MIEKISPNYLHASFAEVHEKLNELIDLCEEQQKEIESLRSKVVVKQKVSKKKK